MWVPECMLTWDTVAQLLAKLNAARLAANLPNIKVAVDASWVMHRVASLN